MKDKKSFLFYYSYKSLFDELSDEEAGQLIKAMIDFEIDEVVPEFSKNRALKMVFIPIMDNLNRDKEKYSERCKINALNGKKGGAPKGNSNAKKQPKTTENNRNKPIRIKIKIKIRIKIKSCSATVAARPLQLYIC